MAGQTLNLMWTTISTNSSTEVFLPAGAWALIDKEHSRGQAWCEVAELIGSGTTSVAPAMEWTNDPQGGSHTAEELMTFVTSEGVKNPDGTATTLAIVGKKWGRPGWLMKSSNSSQAYARVAGTIQLFAP